MVKSLYMQIKLESKLPYFSGDNAHRKLFGILYDV
jgi:hypothetical protein